jgi:hypothetical protein
MLNVHVMGPTQGCAARLGRQAGENQVLFSLFSLKKTIEVFLVPRQCINHNMSATNLVELEGFKEKSNLQA